MPPPPADRGEKRADLAGAAFGLLRSAAGLLAGGGGEDAGVRDVWFTEVDAAGVEGFKEVQNSQLAEALTEADVFSCEEMQAFGIDMSFWAREDPAERKYYIRVQDRRLQMHAGVWDDAEDGNDLQHDASPDTEQASVTVVPSRMPRPTPRYNRSQNRVGIAANSLTTFKRNQKIMSQKIDELKEQNASLQAQLQDSGQAGSMPSQDVATLSNVIDQLNQDKASLQKQLQDAQQQSAPPAVEINDKLQAAVTKAIHDGVSGALHDLAPPRPPRSPSPEPAETVLGLDADFLASIAQSARFGRRVTSHDILCAGMAATLTLCAAKQMTLEYRRRFNRPAPALDAIDADALPGYSREVLLAFKLVDVCLKPNWTRVGTQKRIELEFYAAVKGLVEASLAR